LLWFGLALAFSLAGDILLLLPARFFIPGLAAFLLGHIAYLAGLTVNLPPVDLANPILLVTGAGLIGLFYPRIRAGLRSKPGGKKLNLPVLAYSLVLTAMMLTAVLTLFRLDWQRNAAVLAALGGVLFLISDLLLAFDRFVNPVRHGRLLVMVTYHLAQMALVGGALLQFRP
jgi:alkenylglycerophosphocholine/alkenylglycerophosphoethanolamine hydrolase